MRMPSTVPRRPCRPSWLARAAGAALLTLAATDPGWAHGVSAADRAFMEQGGLMAFLYLGAKHMVTGYDHLLFLFGVIFFLYRMRDVGLYVTLFAVGHSLTLLYGVLSGTHVNPYLVDAVIGFSVVYKALDNLGAFRHQAPGLRAAPRRPGAEDRRLQRRRRDRPAAGAGGHPHRHGLLAAHGGVLAPGLRRQRDRDDLRLRADGVSDRRLRGVVASRAP
jgi:hypothetical protein